MADQIAHTFAKCREQKRTCMVNFITAGFPNAESTIPIMQAFQKGGCDIIELGMPFTDPIGDGPSIQYSNQVALDGGVTSLDQCLQYIRDARKAGVVVPIILMGYYNPILGYGEAKFCKAVSEAGGNGFIVVDLPPEESHNFRVACKENNLSFVPLLTPVTTVARMKKLVECASSFVYCVSVTGTTGERAKVSEELPNFIDRVRSVTDVPIAIGFGISTREHFTDVGKLGDGVVIGSAYVRLIRDNPGSKGIEEIPKFCRSINGRDGVIEPIAFNRAEVGDAKDGETHKTVERDDCSYRFGEYGGRYVPEMLVEALDELEDIYLNAIKDPEFIKEIESYYSYVGRPTPLHMAERLTESAGGARIWLKREDLNHTGAHKINNAIGQALLAKRIGKSRMVAETGAGQHGVATATVCAKLNLKLVVYMGAEDVRRQSLNVFRMKLLGAEVVPVTSGSKTLKDAVNEAMRDWVTNIRDTHYLLGSAVGPHPFPTIVRHFQSIIGKESREQMLEKAGKLPDAVVACVGGGSNAIGMFHPFVNDPSVKLYGTEAGGFGVGTGKHSSKLVAGKPGVLHGARSYLLQEEGTGQIMETHSISAGLDYPGVGPEHCFLKDSGRAEYVSVDDKQALEGFELLSREEGIIPALESAHAVYYAHKLAKSMPKDSDLLICVSGRGDKDINTVREVLPQYNM
eukprot:Nk52_evm46s621 gene=Nk52_evmTU46s621